MASTKRTNYCRHFVCYYFVRAFFLLLFYYIIVSEIVFLWVLFVWENVTVCIVYERMCTCKWVFVFVSSFICVCVCVVSSVSVFICSFVCSVLCVCMCVCFSWLVCLLFWWWVCIPEREREKGLEYSGWGCGKILARVGGGETMIRLYCIKNDLKILKVEKN